MEPQVTLNVTFKNETQSFLVSDPENTTWADVEAMVSVILFCFVILEQGYSPLKVVIFRPCFLAVKSVIFTIS